MKQTQGGPTVLTIAAAERHDRGRILYVDDVRALLGRTPDGEYRKSSWWVRRNVAPKHKWYLGKDAVWYETDVLRWIAETSGERVA